MILGVLILHAQTPRLETTIKVVSDKVRIAVKAVDGTGPGGVIEGRPANFTFILAIPIDKASSSPATITRLSPAHLPVDMDPASGTSFTDANFKYFWYSFVTLQAAVATYPTTELDVIEISNWNGPAQTGLVSLVSLADGTSTPPPPLDGLWNHYWQLDGIQYSFPGPGADNLFYASATSGTLINGDTYSDPSSVTTNLLVTLPASLLNFSGYKSGAKNSLRWTTASESNNLGFDVQRSIDGINYSSIGFVNSKALNGNSSSNITYTFDDNSPIGKKQYYRLNQKDIDGRSKISNIVTITGDKPVTLGIGGLFPNPAQTKVSVIIDAPARQDVTLMVTDMSGKTVKQQIVNVEIGSNTVPVDISTLAQGSYLIKAVCKSSDCGVAVGKFNKQ
jgi:hypothetical protein